MTKVPLKQFVRGKLSGTDRPNYEVVAKSRNIDDAEIQNVLQVFNGSQPLATEIPKHSGSWLISPIGDNEIALLRQERSLEKEFGRQYFLYEHYRIFNTKHLKRIHKIWLLSFLPHQQEKFTSISQLDDQISINEDFLIKAFSSTLADLFTSNVDNFVNGAIQNLYTLLNKQKLKVSGTIGDIKRMATALSLILPSSQTHNYKVFIGKDLPYSWDWEIAFQINSGLGDTNIPDAEKILSGKINDSYTKIIYKILHSNKKDWQDFPDRLDIIKLDTIHNKNDLEKVLGNALFQDIGLRLINIDIKLKRANADDVHIAWKELSDSVNSRDIELILPIILEDEEAWDAKDYDALRKSISKYARVVRESLVRLYKSKPEKFDAFLGDWLKKSPLQKELDFIVDLLFDLHYQTPSLLLEVLQKRDGLDFKLLVLLFICDTLQVNDVLLLANWILRKTKTKKEIVEIFPKISNNIRNKLLSQIINNLILAARENNFNAFEKEQESISSNLNGISTESKSIFFANLLVFSINLRLENIIMFLLLEKRLSYEFIQYVDIGDIQDIESQVMDTLSSIVIAAYIITLHKTNNAKQAVDFLTEIILANTKKIESVLEVLHKSLDPKRYSSISLNKLNNLTDENKATIFIRYISIKKTLSDDENKYFTEFLKSISYTPLILSQLEKIYHISLKAGYIDLCQLILELQIRDTIIQRNPASFEKKMEKLHNLNRSHRNVWKNRIVTDYLNTLTNTPEKQGFIEEILLEPYSSFNNPKTLKKAFITSLILKDNFRKIYEDVNCRLLIYQWAYKEYSASSNT